jgi:hypothetical protein
MILSVSLLEFFRDPCPGVTLYRRCLREGETSPVRTGADLLSNGRDYVEGDVKGQKRQEVKVLVISD